MSKAIVDLRDKIDPELHLINQKCLVDNLSTTLIFTKSALYGYDTKLCICKWRLLKNIIRSWILIAHE